MTPLPCSPPEVHTYGNEWQSISWDADIYAYPTCKQRRQVVYRKALLSRIKVKKMPSWISQIKHIDDGSNDNVFWQIFEELQNQSQQKDRKRT